MRLREIREILKQALPALNVIAFEGIALPNGQPGSRVHKWRAALEATQALSKVRALKPQVSAVLSLDWGQVLGEPAMVAAPVSTPMVPAFHELEAAATILDRLLDSLLPPETSPTISVKLPEPQTLKELEQLVSDVNSALARPADVLFGPCIKFSNVDNGSTWIDLVVEAAKNPVAVAGAGAIAVGTLRKNVLGFLGGLVDLYGKLVRVRQRHRMVEAHLRSLGMSSAAEEAAGKHETEEAKLSTEEVERLVQLYGADSEHRADAIPVALHATKIGASLLERRTEIHARLESSESSGGAPVEGWPDPEEIKRLVSSPVAQMTEKSEAETAQHTAAKKDP